MPTRPFCLGLLGVLLSFVGIIISRRAENAAKAAEKSALQTADEVAKAAKTAKAQTLALVSTIDSVVVLSPFLEEIERCARHVLQEMPSPKISLADNKKCQSFIYATQSRLRMIRADCSRASGIASGKDSANYREYKKKIDEINIIVLNAISYTDDDNLVRFEQQIYDLIDQANTLKTLLTFHAVTVGEQMEANKTPQTETPTPPSPIGGG
jgi:glutamine synthetase adenylyltransferase